MSLRPLDRLRRDLEASEKRLARARAALEALTNEERARICVELASSVEASLANAPKDPPATTKPRKGPGRVLDQETFADRAARLLAAHPEGLRAFEVGRAIGQSPENAHGTLKLLARTGRAKQFGKLWGLPDAVPTPRVDTIAAMIEAALADRRVLSSEQVRARVGELAEKPVKPDSIDSELARLVAARRVRKVGANEFGVQYALPDRPDEGGDPTASVS